MSYHCFKCNGELSISTSATVGRGETCPKCRADVHACLNCKHYDTAAYNQCKESSAERVVEKDRSNFCDYFAMREGLKSLAQADEKKKVMKKLDDLFK